MKHPLSKEQYEALGAKTRANAANDNLLISAFAAEMIGESYPLSPRMCATVFEGHNDETLGRKFVEWIEKHR